MDGTVTYVEFDYKEVGRPLTREETGEFFMNKYNHDINASVGVLQNSNTHVFNMEQSGGGQSVDQKAAKESTKLIENFDILLAQEQKEKQQLLHSQNQVWLLLKSTFLTIYRTFFERSVFSRF